MTVDHPALTIDDINAMSLAEFVAEFGGIYEHSSWVAEQAFDALPIAGIQELADVMADVVANSSLQQQQALVNAHPELGSAKFESLTESSRQEQQGAGFNEADYATLGRFKALNQEYRERHGFPFIIAVAGLHASTILKALEQRLPRTSEEEFSAALDQIDRIALHRLEQRIAQG